MVLWIGVDDTDSLDGMCTTFLATEIVRELARTHDLIGYPRLVRLNPNIPWKTRGNGAICLRVGSGRGDPFSVGWIGGREVLAYGRGKGTNDAPSVVEAVARLVENWSCFADPTTNPAFVVLRQRPSPHLYWRAVREIVPVPEARRAAESRGIVRTYKEGRGIVGATAAVAWRPRDRTYEILAYRARERWGTRREISPASVIEMDQAFPSTFNNFDYENGRVVIAPRSPCPVLCGIRGDDPRVLPAALSRIRGEPPDRWVLFETNQGTDDHVLPHGQPIPFRTIRLRGAVTATPRSIPGGHVLFRVDGYDVCAYEPSKQFRQVVRHLLVGDRVDVIGAVRETPRTINLEKLFVRSLAPRTRKHGNPACPTCGVRTKSMGRDAPYRCRRCGTRVPRSAAMFSRVDPGLSEGWYEPPIGSHRHLMKPLRRMARASDRFRLGKLFSQPGRPHALAAVAASVPRPGIR